MTIIHEPRAPSATVAHRPPAPADHRDTRFWAHFGEHSSSPTRWSDSAKASWSPALPDLAN
ncbi:hypothetical protein [Agromyces larvae]|uniref:Uncharacterized protein n=1 Tax=Agromyces larvae TaxID=2929802 RepID=A0ABY4C5W4_9MICO|nr:hypothetical protein [Agromyces larvae]UOE45571.1 hypothetical protein MTO99_07405 [Agromyces larvae]